MPTTPKLALTSLKEPIKCDITGFSGTSAPNQVTRELESFDTGHLNDAVNILDTLALTFRVYILRRNSLIEPF